MVDLPNQGKMIVPVEWTIQTQKSTMTAAGYTLSTTIGIRPFTASSTFSWNVTKAEADVMLDQFELTNFNGVYDYNDLTRGPIKVRLAGDASYQETRGSIKGVLTATVYRV